MELKDLKRRAQLKHKIRMELKPSYRMRYELSLIKKKYIADCKEFEAMKKEHAELVKKIRDEDAAKKLEQRRMELAHYLVKEERRQKERIKELAKNIMFRSIDKVRNEIQTN